jgi:hypothetical protein
MYLEEWSIMFLTTSQRRGGGGGGGIFGVSYSDDIVFDMFVISILNSNFKFQF